MVVVDFIGMVSLILSLGLCSAYADASEELRRKAVKDPRSLEHGIRLTIRAVWSVLIALIHLGSDRLGSIWSVLYVVNVASVLFLFFHIVFDPVKNILSGKGTWYMGRNSFYDRLCRWLYNEKAGQASMAIEIVLVVFFTWLLF